MSLSVRTFYGVALVSLGLTSSVGCGGGASDGRGADPDEDSTESPGGGSSVGSSTTPGDTSSSVSAATTDNPFAGASMYVNPDYALEVQSSMDLSPGDAQLLYQDAHQGAPEAGQWFHDYFVEAVKAANPPL